MATRGIYVFTSEKYGIINVYNHWDNYPDGAKKFFEAALLLSKNDDMSPHSSFLDVFIKANPTTEIIGSAATKPNWGQEYTYYIQEKDILRPTESVSIKAVGEFKNYVFSGTLEEFLNS